MSGLTFIGKRSVDAGGIRLRVPTVGEALDDEQALWREVSLFTKNAYDLLSELDKMGLDPEKVSDYEVFVLLLLHMQRTGALKKELLFDLPLSSLIFDGIRFCSRDGSFFIDRQRYQALSALICKMLCREKTAPIHFGNELAKRKRIELDAKKKQQKQAGGISLEAAVLRLVCRDGFYYGFKTIRELNICELLYALKQIDRDILIEQLYLAKADTSQISRYVI